MRKTIKKCCRDCVVAFLVISLFISPVTISAEQDSTSGEQRILRTARQRLRTRITYNCTEKPIETVLMDLAEQAQVDIVKSPKVTGSVTVKVTDVPLEEALTNILAAHDFTYIATESMIRVVPLPEIAVLRESLVTRIYQITYADANEVATALGGFVSQRGKVALNKGTSHIIVTDTEDKIRAIDKFIEEIDLMTPQVLVEVRIYDITTSEGFELGAQWHAGRNAPMTADTILLPTETTTTVIEPSLTGFAESRTDTTQTGDVRTTTDIDRTDFHERRTDRRVGVERGDTTSYTDTRTEDSWTDPTEERETIVTDNIIQTIDEYSRTIDSGGKETENMYVNPPAIITNRRRKPFVGGSFDSIRGGSLRFSVLNDAVDIDLALSVLSKEVEVKLLANPRVLVLDNQTANFEIVREIPYRELWQVAREDPITYTEFKNVGVQLNVTPHIARDGMIRLHIVPEFGVLVSQDAIGVQAGIVRNELGIPTVDNRMVLGVPTVDTRRADTIAMIRDGQTIVIGGLRKREATKSISKVPVLGDIPLIGGLFKSETESVKINELVIFITTRIVTEPVLSEVERRQLEATEFASPGMTKMRLERNNQLKPTVDEFKVEELTELIDMLLRK